MPKSYSQYLQQRIDKAFDKFKTMEKTICAKCGKLMCDNFINTGSCTRESVPDWVSLSEEMKEKLNANYISACIAECEEGYGKQIITLLQKTKQQNDKIEQLKMACQGLWDYWTPEGKGGNFEDRDKAIWDAAKALELEFPPKSTEQG